MNLSINMDKLDNKNDNNEIITTKKSTIKIYKKKLKKKILIPKLWNRL